MKSAANYRLKKAVCQRCEYRPGGKWTIVDEMRWRGTGEVFCYYNGYKKFRIMDRERLMDWCPYWLEHVMDSQPEIEPEISRESC